MSLCGWIRCLSYRSPYYVCCLCFDSRKRAFLLSYIKNEISHWMKDHATEAIFVSIHRCFIAIKCSCTCVSKLTRKRLTGGKQLDLKLSENMLKQVLLTSFYALVIGGSLSTAWATSFWLQLLLPLMVTMRKRGGMAIGITMVRVLKPLGMLGKLDSLTG